jgi:hypothetical protein
MPALLLTCLATAFYTKNAGKQVGGTLVKRQNSWQARWGERNGNEGKINLFSYFTFSIFKIIILLFIYRLPANVPQSDFYPKKPEIGSKACCGSKAKELEEEFYLFKFIFLFYFFYI